MSHASPANSDAEPQKVGEIPELVHIIGGMLKDDRDYQSLGRMSAACKLYQEDLRSWMDERLNRFKSLEPEVVPELNATRLRLAESSSGIGCLALSMDAGFRFEFLDSIRLEPLPKLRHITITWGLHTDPIVSTGSQLDAPSLESVHIATGIEESLNYRLQQVTHSSSNPPVHHSPAVSPGYMLKHVHESSFRQLKHHHPKLRKMSLTLEMDYKFTLAEVDAEGAFWEDSRWMDQAGKAGVPVLAHEAMDSERDWTWMWTAITRLLDRDIERTWSIDIRSKSMTVISLEAFVENAMIESHRGDHTLLGVTLILDYRDDSRAHFRSKLRMMPDLLNAVSQAVPPVSASSGPVANASQLDIDIVVRGVNLTDRSRVRLYSATLSDAFSEGMEAWTIETFETEIDRLFPVEATASLKQNGRCEGEHASG